MWDYIAYIVKVLTYASETWTLSKSEEILLAAFERCSEGFIAPYVWKDNGGAVIMTSYKKMSYCATYQARQALVD